MVRTAGTERKEARGGPGALALWGGELCLDFANTVDPRHGERRREYLRDYDDLVAWALHSGAIESVHAEKLRREAARRPREAERVHREAIALREALYALFAAAASGTPAPREALGAFHLALARSLAMGRIVPDENGFRWAWADDKEALDRVLWPVVRSAADLLTSERLARVRECPGADGNCGWLFVDTTKNARRRWCSMEACGNRAKARRHYQRVRARA